jgi:uncharacterized membrane protein
MQIGRVAFIDLLRGWAILVMIETHVFNAMILPALRETAWSRALDFINGLVAPSFLFVSGFVFIISMQRKIEDMRTLGPLFWKQIGRIGLIWVVAYGLHLPAFSYQRLAAGVSETSWLKFFQVDILHCIAAGWLFLLCSFLMIRSEAFLRRWLTASGVLFVAIAPLIWEIDFLGLLPAPLAAYLNGKHYSLFPIFPWVGFMLAGGVTALYYLSIVRRSGAKDFIRRITVYGVVLIVVCSLLLQIPIQLEFLSSSIRANPLFFFVRLGMVLLLATGCWLYSEHRDVTRSFVIDASRESFLIYVVHLLVIYGDFWSDKSIAKLYGKTFSPLECMLAALAFLITMVLTAKSWGWVKRRSKTAARGVSWAVAAIIAAVFFIR